MPYPDYTLSRAFKFWKRTSGDLSLVATTPFAAVPTVSSLVLQAEVGDVLEAVVQATYGSEASHAFLDVSTGSNYFSGDGTSASEGVPGWTGTSGTVIRTGGTYLYTVQAADVSSGDVTLTLHYRVSTATARTLRANAGQPLLFGIKNLGPVDPY